MLYSALYATVMLALLPFEYAKRPPQQRPRWISEKLGNLPNLNGRSIWVHAVSVGEVVAAAPFVHALTKAYPNDHIVVSTITDTGQKVARERMPHSAHVVYLPFDLPGPINKAIAAINPRALIIMETELWPNLIGCATKSGVPVAMLNGRISEKSYRGYSKVAFLLKGMLNQITLYGMQDEEYAKRIVALGAPSERVQTLGNFKFDYTPANKPISWACGLKGPVVLVGSTHRGEDAIMIDAFGQLKAQFPSLTMIIAPRHPERFDEVAQLIQASGHKLVRRSAIGSEEELSSCIVLLDTVGELSASYAICDVAVVGGSFIPHGGQNPLEPAAWGKPTLCGPHMHNFPFVREFYAHGAALEVNAENLASELARVLGDQSLREQMGQAARHLMEQNRGAVERAINAIGTILK